MKEDQSKATTSMIYSNSHATKILNRRKFKSDSNCQNTLARNMQKRKHIKPSYLGSLKRFHVHDLDANPNQVLHNLFSWE